MQSSESIRYEADQISYSPSYWPKRSEVDVRRVMYQGREVALVFKCTKEAAQVGVLAKRNGLIHTEDFMKELGPRYIFSAPLVMTIGERKMTELVFREGEQINWLLSPQGKDGLLLVNSMGEPKILDKREMKIKDLLEESDLSNPQIQKTGQKWLKGRKISESYSSKILNHSIRPSKKIWDKVFFLEILKAKRYSLLPGMLLIKGNEEHLLEDGRTSRRFFVEFKDGSYGIMNSSEDMTTADLVQLAKKSGVTKAIYMDTGMYDKATYQDGSGSTHLLGHPDTAESTNRVFIYSK